MAEKSRRGAQSRERLVAEARTVAGVRSGVGCPRLAPTWVDATSAEAGADLRRATSFLRGFAGSCAGAGGRASATGARSATTADADAVIDGEAGGIGRDSVPEAPGETAGGTDC